MSNDGDKTFSTQKPKLLDQVRRTLRTKHYSKRTEEAYVHWIRKYILFHNKRHPEGMEDRVTILPEKSIPALKQHILRVRKLHEHDLKNGCDSVYLPYALEKKYPNAARKLDGSFISVPSCTWNGNSLKEASLR